LWATDGLKKELKETQRSTAFQHGASNGPGQCLWGTNQRTKVTNVTFQREVGRSGKGLLEPPQGRRKRISFTTLLVRSASGIGILKGGSSVRSLQRHAVKNRRNGFDECRNRRSQRSSTGGTNDARRTAQSTQKQRSARGKTIRRTTSQCITQRTKTRAHCIFSSLEGVHARRAGTEQLKQYNSNRDSGCCVKWDITRIKLNDQGEEIQINKFASPWTPKEEQGFVVKVLRGNRRPSQIGVGQVRKSAGGLIRRRELVHWVHHTEYHQLGDGHSEGVRRRYQESKIGLEMR